MLQSSTLVKSYNSSEEQIYVVSFKRTKVNHDKLPCLNNSLITRYKITLHMPKAEVDNILRELQNSSYPTKAKFNNCFVIHSKYFPRSWKSFTILLFVFLLTKYNTTFSLGFIGHRFNNLQRAALLTSFWCHWFNNFRRAALLTSLIQYGEDSFQIWWTAAGYDELSVWF